MGSQIRTRGNWRSGGIFGLVLTTGGFWREARDGEDDSSDSESLEMMIAFSGVASRDRVAEYDSENLLRLVNVKKAGWG